MLVFGGLGERQNLHPLREPTALRTGSHSTDGFQQIGFKFDTFLIFKT